MKIFVDSANLEDIEQALMRGFPAGITTNPSILAKERKADFKDHMKRILELVQRRGYDIPISVEVFSNKPQEMIAQAEDFIAELGFYDNLNVKIPIGWDELSVIHQLRQRNVRVNCTCCMSFNQAVMAANAGANYVSLFYGRIKDTGYDAASVIRQVSSTFRQWNCPTEIIAGSMRQLADVNEAMEAGADIVTVPPALLRQLTQHPKTDEVVNQFLTDFAEWLK